MIKDIIFVVMQLKLINLKSFDMILITPINDLSNGMLAGNTYQALTDNSQLYYILFLGVYLHK